MQQIEQENAEDSVLASLCDVVASAWPAERKETPEHLTQYWSFRDEISVYDGVAYRSHQVIVPRYEKRCCRKYIKHIRGSTAA